MNINEMEYNGSNKVLNANPADLHVYRKRHHHANTTPVGVEQPMLILQFYKHVMPPASLFTRKNRANEMKNNVSNKVLNSNPADLHVYRKRHHHANTTPVGVEQPMLILHYFKHVMPPASTKNGE